MFVQSELFSWLDPHLVLPGGPLWEEDELEDTPIPNTAGLTSSPPTEADKGRFSRALEHVRAVTQSNILSSSAENSFETAHVYQQLRHQANAPSKAPRQQDDPLTTRFTVPTSARDGFNNKDDDDEDGDDGALLGALHGNGLFSLLAGGEDELEATGRSSVFGNSSSGAGDRFDPASDDPFGAFFSPADALAGGGSAAQRQARKEARQAAEMASMFRPLPRHLGVREEPVLCPLDPHEFPITHVASGSGVFAVVTAEMPQRVYVFDQLNDVLITCRELGGEMFSVPSNARWSPYAPSNLAGSDGLSCGIEPCSIERDDRVRAVFMNPSGHVCLVTMESGKAVYIYIPHRPSSNSNSSSSARRDNNHHDGGGAGASDHDSDDDDQDDDDVDDREDGSGAERDGAGKARLANHGAKAWRKSARRWLHLGRRRKSGADQSGSGSDTESAFQSDKVVDDEALYQPVAFSFTIALRRRGGAVTTTGSPVASHPLAASFAGSTASASSPTSATTTAANGRMRLQFVPIESVGWGSGEDGQVTQTCLSHVSTRSGGASRVSAIIGSRQGGLVLGCELVGRRGVGSLDILYRFPLTQHLAPRVRAGGHTSKVALASSVRPHRPDDDDADEEEDEALSLAFPIEAVDVFIERMPGHGGEDADVPGTAAAGMTNASSVPLPPPPPHGHGVLAQFPEYTHRPHFLSTDHYERSAGFEVAPAEADGSAAATSPLTASPRTQATTSTARPAAAQTLFVRATVLLTVKNRLYVCRGERDVAVTMGVRNRNGSGDEGGERPRGGKRGRHAWGSVSPVSPFGRIVQAAFEPLQTGGEAHLRLSYVSLPASDHGSGAVQAPALTASAVLGTAVTPRQPPQSPSGAAAASGAAVGGGGARDALDLQSPARASLQLLSPQGLLLGGRDPHPQASAAPGRVSTPGPLAATLAPTFYWQYNGHVVQGMVLTSRVNAWERLTGQSATAGAEKTASTTEDAWSLRLHERTRRVVARELLGDDGDDAKHETAMNQTDVMQREAAMFDTNAAGGRDVLLPIGILAIRDMQSCIEALAHRTTRDTRGDASLSPRSPGTAGGFTRTAFARRDSASDVDSLDDMTLEGEAATKVPDVDGEPRRARPHRKDWLPLQPALVRGEVTDECRLAMSGLRRQLAMASVHNNNNNTPAPAAFVSPSIPAAPRTKPAASSLRDALVSVSTSYDHILVTTTGGLFVFFHLSVLPMPSSARAWRNQLLLHTPLDAASTPASTAPPLFRVLTDASPAASFYCVSQVSVVRLDMQHSLVDEAVPPFRQHVSQLLDVARAAAAAKPARSVLVESRSSVSASSSTKTKLPTSSSAVTPAHRRSAVLASILRESQAPVGPSQNEENGRCEALRAAMVSAEHARRAAGPSVIPSPSIAERSAHVSATGTETGSVLLADSIGPFSSSSSPSVSSPLLRRNPLLDLLVEHVLGTARHGGPRYALTLPFFGTTAGRLVTSLDDAETATARLALFNNDDSDTNDRGPQAFKSAHRMSRASAQRCFLSPMPHLLQQSETTSSTHDARSGGDQTGDYYYYYYYLCAADYAFEMAIQLALTAVATQSDQHAVLLDPSAGLTPLKAAIAMAGEARHAYGRYLWKRRRFLEAAAQFGRAGPTPLPSLLLQFSRAARGDENGTTVGGGSAGAGHAHDADEDDEMRHGSTFHRFAARQKERDSVAEQAREDDALLFTTTTTSKAASSSYLALVLLLRVRLAECECSTRGTAAHRIKVSVLASILVAVLVDRVSEVESAGMSAILSGVRGAHVRPSLSDHLGASASSTASRAAYLCWKYHLDAPDALLQDVVLRYGRELTWGGAWRAIQRVSNSRTAVWLAGELGHPLEACEGLLSRQHHVLEGLLCLEHLTQHSLGLDDETEADADVRLLLPFYSGSGGGGAGGGADPTRRASAVPAAEARAERRTSLTAWLTAFGVAVSEQLLGAATHGATDMEPHTDTTTTSSDAVQAAQAVLYTSGVFDHSFPQLPQSRPNGHGDAEDDVCARARTDLLTLLGASATAITASSSSSSQAPSNTLAATTGPPVAVALYPGARSLRLRTRANVTASSASTGVLTASALSDLWRRFATQLVLYYPHRVLIHGLCGTFARSGLPFAAERLLPALLTYTPAHNECNLIAGIQRKPTVPTSAAHATASAEWIPRPLTADGVLTLLVLVWGSRTTQRAWQREAGVAQAHALLQHQEQRRHHQTQQSRLSVSSLKSPSANTNRTPATTADVADSDIHLSDEDNDEGNAASRAGSPHAHTPARQLRFDTSAVSASHDRELDDGDDVDVDIDADFSDRTSISDDSMHGVLLISAVHHKKAQSALLRRTVALRAANAATGGGGKQEPGLGDADAETVEGHVALRFLLTLAADARLTEQLWADPLEATLSAAAAPSTTTTLDRNTSFALDDGRTASTRQLDGSAPTRPPHSLWLSLAFLIARDADEAALHAFMELVATKCDAARWPSRANNNGHGGGSGGESSHNWWITVVLPPLFRLFALHKRRRGCAWVYHLLEHHEDALVLLLQEAQQQQQQQEKQDNTADDLDDAPCESLDLIARFVNRAGEAAKTRIEREGTESVHTMVVPATGSTADNAASVPAAAASANTFNPSDVARHTRHDLWLFLLRRVLTPPAVHTALALRLMKRSQGDVDITDVLDFVDASAPMASFKDALYASLAAISTAQRRAKRLFNAAMSDLGVLQKENQIIRDRAVRIEGGNRCFVCHKPSLARPLVAFRQCSHVCHVTCYRDARRRLRAAQNSAANKTGPSRNRFGASTSVSMTAGASFSSPTTVDGGAGMFGALQDFPTPQSFVLDERQGSGVPATKTNQAVTRQTQDGEEEDGSHGGEEEAIECLWCSRTYFDALLTAPLSTPLFTREEDGLPASVLNLL